jgi:hypothetical protein
MGWVSSTRAHRHCCSPQVAEAPFVTAVPHRVTPEYQSATHHVSGYASLVRSIPATIVRLHATAQRRPETRQNLQSRPDSCSPGTSLGRVKFCESARAIVNRTALVSVTLSRRRHTRSSRGVAVAERFLKTARRITPPGVSRLFGEVQSLRFNLTAGCDLRALCFNLRSAECLFYNRELQQCQSRSRPWT